MSRGLITISWRMLDVRALWYAVTGLGVSFHSGLISANSELWINVFWRLVVFTRSVWFKCWILICLALTCSFRRYFITRLATIWNGLSISLLWYELKWTKWVVILFYNIYIHRIWAIVTSIKLSEFLIRNSGGLGGGGEWVSNDWNGGGGTNIRCKYL